ncbi:hypothetical protein U1Q18_052404 [Sarracenia purpurea var. burkii]
MMPSTPFSVKLVQESMSPVLSLLILNQQSLMKCGLEPTASSSTQSNLSAARKTQPTTLLVVIIQLGRRLLTSVWTAFESLLTIALASKGFLFSMLLEGELDLALALFFWSASRLIMARNQSSVSLSIPLHRSPHLLSSLTTVSSRLIPSWNTLMLLCFLTTRPFTTSAGALLTLSDPPTPT